ncbi:MAG: universal stress protein [Nitrospirota bacterium]|nr:universal stress protein [Nitrospirota bacterium]MDH5586655.1 universal stress protein [Nitrospirota bacterium]MDH5774410.1 universal stress protein [Nitrospirota bacterium]
MKALCAVDGSKFSMRAVEALGTLFHQSLRDVVLVHVIDTSLLESGLKKEGTKTGKAKKILIALEAEGKKILKAAEAHANQVLNSKTGKALVKIRLVLAKGHAAHAIVKEAEKREPHLVVLGSRGFHDIQGYFMGSVSRKVLSHAPCPVFIVKDPIQTPVEVVLAVDGSTASMRAANYMKSWISPDVVSVQVLSAVPQAQRGLGASVRAKPYTKALTAAFQKQAREATAQVRSLLLKKKFDVTSEVVSGNPRETILDCLVNHDAGLAVLGAKGLTGPERFQMGSVSEWVAAYSGCSILVVRPNIKRFVV